jgi:phasin family protein
MTAKTADVTQTIQTAFKDATEKAKAAFEKSQASLADVGTFTKGNVEAVVESTKILATGLQEMSKSYVAESKTVVETLTADVKDLASVKSPTEFFEKQNAMLRKQFDAAVAATSKNSEAMLKLASEAFQPISNRVSLAVEKIKHAA